MRPLSAMRVRSRLYISSVRVSARRKGALTVVCCSCAERLLRLFSDGMPKRASMLSPSS